MNKRLLFYLEPAIADTSGAIALRSAWESAVYHKARHALRRELRLMMRVYALRAKALALREAARRAA